MPLEKNAVMIKTRRLSYTGHVARSGDRRDA